MGEGMENVLTGAATWHVETTDVLAGLRKLPDGCVQCCVTSPPYFALRDYGMDGQIGLEATPEAYVARMVEVFREVRRALRDDGTCWVNIGDSYARSAEKGGSGPNGKNASYGDGYSLAQSAKSGSSDGAVGRADRPGVRSIGEGLKPKDLIGIPWMLAFALRDDGWYLRDTIIWAKPNAMPGSQDDRCTSSFEFVFQLSKSARYFSDFEGIKTPPRESSMVRLAQDVQSQAGSNRANGGAKTNGAMKAVGVVDKQRGHFRKHAGFNDRWDQMEKTEQQAAPATMRNVWFISTETYSEAHFAVMPDELARRCLIAGTSERGCCAKCGAPVTRQTKKVRKATRPALATKTTGDSMVDGNRDPERHVTTTETIGWAPSCKCDAGNLPCLVLDPFSGAGTTGVVARRLGLRYIGTELNPEYAAMSRKRIRDDAPMFN